MNLFLRRSLGSQLEGIGVDTREIPKIRLRHGGAVQYKKGINAYTVNLPRWKGNRTAFHETYKKALARIGLDMIQKQKPEIYNGLKCQLDESYRNTQSLLNTYILNTKDTNRIFKAGALKWFGMFHPTYRNPLDHEDLGLTAKKRKSWEDEFIDLYAEIIQKGYESTVKEWKGRLSKAKQTESRAMTEYLKKKQTDSFLRKLAGFTKKARKSVIRATARRQAQEEIQRKLCLIGEAFNLVESEN